MVYVLKNLHLVSVTENPVVVIKKIILMEMRARKQDLYLGCQKDRLNYRKYVHLLFITLVIRRLQPICKSHCN